MADVDREIEHVFAFEIPCDYMPSDSQGRSFPWEHGPARWVAQVRCPACSATGTRLICTACKDILVQTEDGGECAKCGEFVAPFRRGIESIGPL